MLLERVMDRDWGECLTQSADESVRQSDGQSADVRGSDLQCWQSVGRSDGQSAGVRVSDVECWQSVGQSDRVLM